MTPNAAYIALVSELFVLNTLRLIGIGAQAPMFIGLIIRVVAFEGDRNFFDTNTSNHFHYYIEETGSLVDIGTESLGVTGLPELPPGMEIGRIDIIVRLRKAG